MKKEEGIRQTIFVVIPIDGGRNLLSQAPTTRLCVPPCDLTVEDIDSDV